MSTLIRTHDVPAADRIDFTKHAIAATWVPMDCRSDYAADYWGEFRVSGLGPMQVAVLDVLPVTVSRTPELISQADPDLMKVLMVCGDGTSVVDQGGRQARLRGGEFAVYDTQRPYEVSVGVGTDGPTRVMTFMFSPALLPLSPSGRGRISALRIPATAGLGDLTSLLLLQLARNIDDYTPAEAARLSSAALEVLATRLARELDVQDWGTPEARRQALLTTVQAFIQQHLGDPRLAPGAVAAAHHISLRTLHQLFHDEGLTVAGYIRQRRLERCRRDLSDPALDARPVAAIAAKWGFSSASDFSRAFRAIHGLPPSEFRRFARVVKDSAR
ncbi:helix-turn-helix domain-containing protein [Streptosporangiaceae bacterium NEAU-GS5]|nr:helix-turn-helix domain-containing protein [Streptosporangiaceae bacterium NEAU-GS5]